MADNEIRDYIYEKEKMEDEQMGLEHEEIDASSDEDERLEQPFDADKIRIEPRNLSLEYVLKLIKDKKLDLKPEFQRNKVWDIKRKSLLIESLMLRIPIPAFYFYEDEDAKRYVIDGLQRLSAIQEFVDNEFRLRNLQYLGEACNKKFFKNLDFKYVSRINDTQLVINTIDARTPAQVKYDIFRRINTGGVPLNPQEIRNILAKPRIRYFLKSLATSQEFLKATRNRIKPLRMDDQEMVLRFLAFYNAYSKEANKLEKYFNDYHKFLDAEIEKLNTISDSELQKYGIIFKDAMLKAIALFGDEAFSKPDLNSFINKSLYTTWSVLLAHSDLKTDILENIRPKIIDKLKNKLKEDIDYKNSLTQATNYRKNIDDHFTVAQELLEECLC